MVSTEGKVKVVAIPSAQNSTGYVLLETRRQKQSAFSGYGKDYYIYQNSYLEDNNVIDVAFQTLWE